MTAPRAVARAAAPIGPGTPRRRPAGPHARLGGEEASSAVTSVFGVAIFLGFLLLATQVLVHLYTTSTVAAVAFDTARRAAADGSSCADVRFEARIRDALGTYGRRIDPPTCADEGEQTVVTIVGPTPARLVHVLGGGLGLDRIERTARVRTEDFGGAPTGTR